MRIGRLSHGKSSQGMGAGLEAIVVNIEVTHKPFSRLLRRAGKKPGAYEPWRVYVNGRHVASRRYKKSIIQDVRLIRKIAILVYDGQVAVKLPDSMYI